MYVPSLLADFPPTFLVCGAAPPPGVPMVPGIDGGGSLSPTVHAPPVVIVSVSSPLFSVRAPLAPLVVVAAVATPSCPTICAPPGAVCALLGNVAAAAAAAAAASSPAIPLFVLSGVALVMTVLPPVTAAAVSDASATILFASLTSAFVGSPPPPSSSRAEFKEASKVRAAET